MSKTKRLKGQGLLNKNISLFVYFSSLILTGLLIINYQLCSDWVYFWNKENFLGFHWHEIFLIGRYLQFIELRK